MYCNSKHKRYSLRVFLSLNQYSASKTKYQPLSERTAKLAVSMKRILEVLQYGDFDIRFNTDIDVNKHPESVINVATSALYTMITKLWGGNEQSVIAMIRALTIADLAASVNTEEMAERLKEDALALKECMNHAKESIIKEGGRIVTYGPEFKPANTKS